MVFQNNNLTEENTTAVELEDENKFKLFLMNDLLKDHGKYKKELANYFVQFVDPQTDPQWAGTTAAIDVGDRIIFMDINEVKKLQDKRLGKNAQEKLRHNISFLIRHELLHSILRHQERAIVYIANAKGWDPAALDADQYEEVLRLRSQPDIIYRNYNGGIGKQTMDPNTDWMPQQGITTMNGGGDLELSKFYLDRDVELSDLTGGLVLDDHPQWANYSFEQLMTALREEHKQIYRRLYKRVYGTMDKDKMETGDRNAFTVRSRKNSIFSEMTDINPEDVTGIRLLNVYEYQQLPHRAKQMVRDTWLSDGYYKEDEAFVANLYTSKTYDTPDGQFTDVSSRPINERHELYPVFNIPTIDLYQRVQPGSYVNYLGLSLYILPTGRGALLPQSIGQSIYDSTHSRKVYKTTLRNSVAQGALDDWYKEFLAKKGIKK